MEKIKILPILLIQLYLFLTVLLFAFGPWDFKVENPINFYLLLFIYQVCLGVGYYLGINGIRVNKNVSFKSDNFNIKIVKFLMISYLFVLLIDIIRSLGLSSINITGIVNKVLIGIKDPQIGYLGKMEVNQSNVFLGSLGTLIMFIWSPISYAMLPLVIFNYKKFNKCFKILSVVIISLYLMKYIATGTNKGIFDVIIVFISYIIITNMKNLELINKKKKKSVKMYILILILGVISIYTFSYMIGSRSFGVNLNSNTQIGNVIELDHNSIIMNMLPDYMQKPITLLSSYLCQGYYGLSLAMNINSVPMLGMGSSMYIVDQISEFKDINQYTLQKKVEERFGWDSRVQWSSLYSWIANDVGFIGVALFMLFLGLIFAIIYKDCIVNDNIIAKVLFSFLMIELFFIPANNQLMLTLNSVSSTIFFSILWIISKKIRFKN